MEAITFAKDIPMISRQHTSGEVFTAVDLEAARTLCPVLGRLSLEEAGLLLELEAMGKEHIVSAPAIDRHGPARPKEEVVKKDSHGKRPGERGDSLIVDKAPIAKPATAVVVSAANKYREPTYDENLVAEAPQGGVVHNVRQTEASRTIQMPIEQVESVKVAVLTPVEAIKGVVESGTSQLTQPIIASETEPKVREADRPVHDQPVHTARGADRLTDNPGRGKVEAVAPDPIRENTLQIKSVEAAYRHAVDEVAQEQTPHYEWAPVGTNEEEHAEAKINYDPLDIYKDRVLTPTAENSASISVGIDAAVTPNIPESTNTPLALIEVKPEDVSPKLLEVEKVKAIISSLAEAIEEHEPEDLEAIYAVAERIASLSERAGASVDGENVDQSLEELFAELLEKSGVDYSADTVNTLVSGVRGRNEVELIESIFKRDKASRELPEQTGTREFLQKMTLGVVPIRLPLAKLYSIGRSALALYKLQQIDGQLAA